MFWFFFHIVSIFSFFHMVSIFKILQSTFREKFLPSPQPLWDATICIFDDKKIRTRKLIYVFPHLSLRLVQAQTVTLLYSPSHACSSRCHIFAAGHKLINFNPIRDTSLHWFSSLFLIALHIQSPIKMVTNKRIYSMHSLFWYCMKRFIFSCTQKGYIMYFDTCTYMYTPLSLVIKPKKYLSSTNKSTTSYLNSMLVKNFKLMHWEVCCLRK